jgi:hypothetical protein
MRTRHIVGVTAVCFFYIQLATAQDLAPRAYIITPSHSSAINLTWSFYNGGLDFNGAIPIANATGTYHVPTISFYHSFGFFGRSANITVLLPYGVGTFSGEVNGANRSVYRSGLLDFVTRFSVNLVGGPAMPAEKFATWKQKVILGASIKIVAPTGQYNATRLVNWGINRWAVKPEFGYSERWGHWILDGYAGVWLYTTNPTSFAVPKPQQQTQAPIGSLESHLSYSFKQRAWVSVDGNFWWGGITALNSIRNLATEQTSSRVGGTMSIPVTGRQSIKVSYSKGAYIRFGGDYQNVQVSWQYSWIGKH